jgi:hypothetical protein
MLGITLLGVCVCVCARTWAWMHECTCTCGVCTCIGKSFCGLEPCNLVKATRGNLKAENYKPVVEEIRNA